jgi:hypothetical protein
MLERESILELGRSQWWPREEAYGTIKGERERERERHEEGVSGQPAGGWGGGRERERGRSRRVGE